MDKKKKLVNILILSMSTNEVVSTMVASCFQFSLGLDGWRLLHKEYFFFISHEIRVHRVSLCELQRILLHCKAREKR